MLFDIKMHVVGVERVGAGTENGREPAAGGRPDRAEVRRFVRGGLSLNEDAPLVGERDGNEIDGQAFGVSADLGAGDAVLSAAIIAGPGFDLGDLGVQRRCGRAARR